MGFLNVLWRIITTSLVVIPKVWPLIQKLLSFALDKWAHSRFLKNREKELKEAAKEAEEKKDTTKLEELMTLGSGKAVISEDGGSALVQAVEPEPIISEEKKSPEILAEQPSANLGSAILSNPAFRLAAAGLGVYILSSLFTRKEAKAASMGVGSSSSSVILDNSGTIKNRVYFSGGARMGSKLLPVLIAFIMFSGCVSQDYNLERNAPAFSPKIYSADSSTQSLIRRRGMDVVRCDQAAFNEFAALRYDQLICMQRIIDSCEKFTDIPFSCE